MTLNNRLILKEKSINLLAKSYNALDYYGRLIEQLKTVYPKRKFENYSKYQLHELLSHTLIKNYGGEEVLKYELFLRYLNKPNIVAAFEIRVKSSRVDFLTINGHSTSFEIKSELDNLYKLRKQMDDYMLVFDYNYLVVDERHIEKVKNILPSGYGLWCYKGGKYSYYKKAVLNNQINSEIQLSLLSKKELLDNFPKEKGLIKSILESYTKADINNQFKAILKRRYHARWSFVVSNQNNIFPIDIQFFFNTNINPSFIYNH